MQLETVPLSGNSASKERKITFIIGNGFDLGLGMKTKYTHVYDGYIKSPSPTAVIKLFKEELARKAKNNYENWSDFEMGMAAYAQTLENEKELVECVRDFKLYMVEHLQNENQKMIDLLQNKANNYEVIQEMVRSLDKFYEGLTQNDISLLNLGSTKRVVKNFITFNYTTVFDTLLKEALRFYSINGNEPIHIHGMLGAGIVMGVDNVRQLGKTKFKLSVSGKRAFIKTHFNEEYDANLLETVRRIISESSIICVYGFSMGDSDETWVKAISEWLLKDDRNQLIVYQYDTPHCNPCNYDEIMDIEDERKEGLLNRLGIENDSVLDQIHIPVGRDIFNLQHLISRTPDDIDEYDPTKTYGRENFVVNFS